MEQKTTVFIFIDDEPKPIAEFKAPVNFELDTTKLVDGNHVLKVVSKGSDGREGIRIIPFVVENGPAISIEGIRSNAKVDGVLPLMINAYSKGNAKEFNIVGSETPHSIPSWVWILIIGFFGWALYYFFMYIQLKQ